MEKQNTCTLFAIAILIGTIGCNAPGSGKTETEIQDSAIANKAGQREINLFGDSLQFYYSVKKDTVNYKLPAIQSFAVGEHNGLWIFIGGEKKGFHGTVSNPVPFPANKANDSIWVVDFIRQRSWSVGVPTSYGKILSATNHAFCQAGDTLYLCGGFTRNADTAKNFNCTSNYFLEMNLGSLVQYVQTGGKSFPFSQVITKSIQDSFVQVTGGELVYTNGYFYLIGGQNYQKIYAAGRTGTYTNAIRTFRLQQLLPGQWSIGNKASLIDTVNLHRRDMNLVFLPRNNQPQAILYGGVFTSSDEAFRNPIFINGLSTSNPSIKVDSLQQTANQYSCASISFSAGASGPVLTTFFGGISYTMYDSKTNKLKIGDNGIPMPWSNLISSVASDNGVIASKEFIQLPPNTPLLPQYMGANAAFIPLESYRSEGSRHILDLGKVMKNANGSETLIGFIVGGIISGGPTSGVTPDRHVPTFPNADLYKVYLVIK
jgi:hypothetical protein